MKAISGKTMCRILKRLGWTHVRTRGSHRRFERPGYLPITVPVHRNESLKTGLQKTIMKAAGLTDDDL
jgi:predicted RNA binding protein YcfA (HicA-like mRNA interferase family)